MKLKQERLSFIEFSTLMALLMSMTALAIDAILPAIGVISQHFSLGSENEGQLLISSLFVGLALGQMLYGPMSDSIGRKKSIYIGLAFFCGGCLLSYFGDSYEFVLLGRALQGFGAAGPRIITVALVRDEYKGDAMARIMSLIMTIFILVPALAPIIGQGLMQLFGWRSIFFSLLFMAIIGWIWMALRQPETLKAEHRKEFSFKMLCDGIKETFSFRASVLFIFAAGSIFGAFVGYLNSVQQIFDVVYGVGDDFPLYFAVLALSIGSASFFNSQLVIKLGMLVLAKKALISLFSISTCFLLFSLWIGTNPSLQVFMIYMLVAFFCIGILFGNFNSLAMEPLGHIAGIASAVVASIQTFLSVIIGFSIGYLFDGTLVPMTVGFCLLSLVSLVLLQFAEHTQVKQSSK